MHHKSQVTKYTAIKQLICSYLLYALSIYATQQDNICIDPEKIHLHKDREKNFLQYISGVALGLKNSHNCAMHQAGEIVDILSDVCGENVKLMIREPGLIHLKVTEPIISVWLQNRVEKGELGVGSGELGVGSGDLGVGNLLSGQYAHARCCSLIQMCLREGLIKLNKVNLSVNSGYQREMGIIPLGNEILPSPLPWLGSDNKLRFYKKAERVLLSELIQVVDDIVCPFTNSSVNWEKVTLNLSQAFDNFWCDCRIMRNSDIELARARFGLVLAVRSVLQFLLEKKLGVFAPFEL